MAFVYPGHTKSNYYYYLMVPPIHIVLDLLIKNKINWVKYTVLVSKC